MCMKIITRKCSPYTDRAKAFENTASSSSTEIVKNPFAIYVFQSSQIISLNEELKFVDEKNHSPQNDTNECLYDGRVKMKVKRNIFVICIHV